MLLGAQPARASQQCLVDSVKKKPLHSLVSLHIPAHSLMEYRRFSEPGSSTLELQSVHPPLNVRGQHSPVNPVGSDTPMSATDAPLSSTAPISGMALTALVIELDNWPLATASGSFTIASEERSDDMIRATAITDPFSSATSMASLFAFAAKAISSATTPLMLSWMVVLPTTSS